MAAAPWLQRDVPQPDREYVALATRLAKTPGLLGYSLKSDTRHLTFFTLSAWRDDASLRAFANAEPHHQIIQGLRPHMKDSQFEFFTARGEELPLSWATAMARMFPSRSH